MDANSLSSNLSAVVLGRQNQTGLINPVPELAGHLVAQWEWGGLDD